jgi:hypothetical protein
MIRRLLPIPIFHIDSNRINARGKLDAMNRLERWKDDGVILINMSGVSFKEALGGNNPTRTKKAFEHIFTTTDVSVDTNNPTYKRIETAIFPGGAADRNEENDVKIVYEAAYYHAILVTGDGNSRRQPRGILGGRESLRDLVQIMTDIEALEFIKTRIAKRDYYVRIEAVESGFPLPEWVGRD